MVRHLSSACISSFLACNIILTRRDAWYIISSLIRIGSGVRAILEKLSAKSIELLGRIEFSTFHVEWGIQGKDTLLLLPFCILSVAHFDWLLLCIACTILVIHGPMHFDLAECCSWIWIQLWTFPITLGTRSKTWSCAFLIWKFRIGWYTLSIYKHFILQFAIRTIHLMEIQRLRSPILFLSTFDNLDKLRMVTLFGIPFSQKLLYLCVFTYSLLQKLQLKLRWIGIGTLVSAGYLTVDSSRILFLESVVLLIMLYWILGVHVLTQNRAIALWNLILLASNDLSVWEHRRCQQTCTNQMVEDVSFIGHFSCADRPSAV